MSKAGEEYEILVKNIYEEILKNEDIDNIKVEHDVKIEGKSTTHQIDVYWEHRIGNSNFRMIIQAKDWKRPVPQKEVLALAEIVEDLPTGTKGVFISRSGYQEGAIKVAQAKGIDIYELRQPNDKDFKDKIMKAEIKINIEIPYYENMSIVVNKNKSPNIKEKRLCICGDTIVYEKTENKTIKEIILELCNNNGKNIENAEYKFNEGYIILDDNKIFVEKLIGKFGISQVSQSERINGYDNIGLILKDIIKKETQIFDKQNKFVKHIEDK